MLQTDTRIKLLLLMRAQSVIAARFGTLLRQLSPLRIADQELVLIRKLGHLALNQGSGGTGVEHASATTVGSAGHAQ